MSGFRDSSGGWESRLIHMNSSFLKIGLWEKQSLSLYPFHHQIRKELGFVQSASVHLGVWKKIILENGGQKFPPTSPSPPICWCFSSLGLITFLYLYLGNWKGQWSVVRWTNAYWRRIRIILGLISTVCSRVKIKIASRSIYGSKAYWQNTDCIASMYEIVSVLISQDFIWSLQSGKAKK